ncbi:hypothetical protein [Aquisalimonas asiatica]|uniref:Phage integrase family protein n=1 Tax=Aquisalimonas asiatica TaxID=406100 RepID=A0A1H8UWC7_9GAMM|nr:hypothetical protein [Aquisalimonas asiatica]SEP07520.1 hypothetical protein SAMN04488052_108112 [Aquisalimonas asiatica]
MNAVDLTHWLADKEASDIFVEISGDLLTIVPEGFDLQADVWDILPWLKRVGNKNQSKVYFDVIVHYEMKMICKLWVLHARRTRNVASRSSVFGRIVAFEALSHVLGARSFKTLKTDDFNAAERRISDKYRSPYRFSSFLQLASNWLSVSFNMRLDYKNRLENRAAHGRHSTEKEREEKLIPIEIVRAMFEARHREDLIAKDKFLLSVLAITIAAGFRVGELVMLPTNCLLKFDGALHLLHHPEKGGRPVPRPIHPLLADMVEDAVNKIITETSEAREVAKRLGANPQLDWSEILNEPTAFRYFTAKWAHAWTSDPNHLMINPAGAWYTKGRCFIDAIGAYEAAGRNQSQAAKNLGLNRGVFTSLMANQEAARRGELPPVSNGKMRGQARESWDTDQRVLSILRLEEHCGTALTRPRRDVVQDIIDKAQALQLQGRGYPKPPFDTALESRFRRQVRPLIKDSNGEGILYQDEALLIIQKYALSARRGTKEGDFSSVSESTIARWLTGEARSRGTANHEDSVFNRLGILDPRTGEVAKFTTHDIRHWLNTIYQNGGLSEDQIALIFNRTNKQQNATYDQTSSKVRAARLKQAVRNKVAVGQVAESYNLLAEFSREDAEDYLEAVLRMVNPMPHGVCTLDWATTPCPHHLSCFSCSDEKPCEHLVVEPGHDQTTEELKRMQRESQLVAGAIAAQGVEDSPTLDHFKRISQNVGIMLDQIRQRGEEDADDGVA